MKNSNFDLTELQAENQALLTKKGELQAENKSWHEMVDSVNQTNQAMGNMLNDLEAKVKELEAKVEGNGWLPIETAPKEGSQILIFEKRVYKLDEEEMFIARWIEDGWYIGDNDDVDCWAENPTHWMPLPELPTKIKGE